MSGNFDNNDMPPAAQSLPTEMVETDSVPLIRGQKGLKDVLLDTNNRGC